MCIRDSSRYMNSILRLLLFTLRIRKYEVISNSLTSRLQKVNENTKQQCILREGIFDVCVTQRALALTKQESETYANVSDGCLLYTSSNETHFHLNGYVNK